MPPEGITGKRKLALYAGCIVAVVCVVATELLLPNYSPSTLWRQWRKSVYEFFDLAFLRHYELSATIAVSIFGVCAFLDVTRRIKGKRALFTPFTAVAGLVALLVVAWKTMYGI